MDAFTGFASGFTGDQEETYKRNYEQDAAQRAQESKLYEYLLQSQDPQMRALAMSGMFESAAGGKRKKGLRGAMGEIQGGEMYPQVLAYMNQLVPDTDNVSSAPQPPAAPGSAAMSTNQAVRPGAAPIQMPSAPPTQDPEIAEMGGGGAPALGPPEGPLSAGAALPPPPPPESKWKRRGTGVPTAEEIAESNARAGIRGRLAELMPYVTTPGNQERLAMGLGGVPQPVDSTASGPQMADPQDPETPIPTIRHRDGTVTMLDGSPLPPNLVGYVKASSAGQTTKTVRDPQSISGYSAVTYAPDGTETRRVPTEFVPPPAYSGAATAVDANGNPVIIGVPRQGVPGNVIAQAPSSQPTQEQSDATALLAQIDKAIADAEVPRIQGRPRVPRTDLQKDQIARERAAAGGLPYTTYLEVQRAARQQRRPSAAPTQPKSAATPGGGGSALSMADQIRADLLERQRAAQGQSTPPTPLPPAPARARGAGPAR